MLIESVDDEVITGRSQWDSPEVDFQINIDIPEEADFSAKRVQPGDFVEVEITDVLPYDLYGKIV